MASAGAGFLLSVVIARRWQGALGARLPVRVMAVALGIATVGCLLLLAAQTAAHMYATYGVIAVALSLATMVFPTALQTISPDHLRGRVTAIQFIVASLMGATGPPLVGFVSDRLPSSGGGALVAIVAVAAPALLAAALLLLSCERRGLDAALSDAAGTEQ